jgi:cysteine protease ATG4
MSADALMAHYISTYSVAELKTFHCDRVRKMPLSGLDPSMLIGFLCKDERDWTDFRKRVNEVGVSSHVTWTCTDVQISDAALGQSQDHIYCPG